jgi:DNA invertase Pin-like site-specific DNA recombinase
MPYRQLKPRQAVEPNAQTQAISARPVAIIARQSTTRQTQEHLESMKLQIEDARQRFINQGWSEDIITIRVAGGGKRGVSGTLRIDQRSELQDTLADAKAGKIKAIGAYSVSRLFRDKYGVQVGTFMEVCAQHDVLVMLPNQIFDFNNQSDVMMFKLLASVAAMENEQRAKLMTDAKRRKSMRGEYDGRPLVVGFIVDRTKTLPDGKPNPTYGRFIVYEPHAKVVRRLYARYRELGGRFNLLAREVAQMAVVFPDFEEWVSSLDVAKLQLKRVPGGYHISRWGLHHLLMAIEYVGYWKHDGVVLTDSVGEPLKTHQAIVDRETWEYAFNRLSHTTLTGEPNIERIDGKAGWVTGKSNGDEQMGGLLQGILTSTQGSVRYSSGIYNVAEQREGHSQWSNTLSVDAAMIDKVFRARLARRLLEMRKAGNFQFILRQLSTTKKRNEKALVSVDAQIARYKNEIAGIQAYILATGATADTKTLQDFNEQLLDARANLDALEAKKNKAVFEEEGIKKLVKRLNEMTGLDSLQSTEESRQFIGLACESVSLDEYSSHFITLTIRWRAPFTQTDVCYIHRGDGGRQEWTEADEFELAMLYPLVDRRVILERFPTRSWLGIMSWAKERGMERYTRVNTSGIVNRVLSLRDHELLQANGWSLENPYPGTGIKKRDYWLYDVTTDSDTSANLSGSGHYL